MDWHQLWEITSAPDNVPIVALIGSGTFLLPGTGFGRRSPTTADRATGSRPATGQDASPQDAAVEAGLDQRKFRSGPSCCALSSWPPSSSPSS